MGGRIDGRGRALGAGDVLRGASIFPLDLAADVDPDRAAWANRGEFGGDDHGEFRGGGGGGLAGPYCCPRDYPYCRTDANYVVAEIDCKYA
jgi:hypothetical protein